MSSAISVIVVGGVGAAQPLLSYLSLDRDLDVQTNMNLLHQEIVCPSIVDPIVGVGRMLVSCSWHRIVCTPSLDTCHFGDSRAKAWCRAIVSSRILLSPNYSAVVAEFRGMLQKDFEERRPDAFKHLAAARRMSAYSYSSLAR